MEVGGCVNKNGGIKEIVGHLNDNVKHNCDRNVEFRDGGNLPLNKDDSLTRLDHANSSTMHRKVDLDSLSDIPLLSSSTATDSGEISLMQDSSSDLQWCTELDYHYQSDKYSRPPQQSQLHQLHQKSVFEGSLIEQSSSSDYITAPLFNYEQISKNIDVNLAEIDIETFRSEDINNVFKHTNNSFAESGDDSLSLLSSFDRLSLFDKSESIFLLKNSDVCRMNNDNDDDDTRENTRENTRKKNLHQSDINKSDINKSDLNQSQNLVNGISIDSLDRSFGENNTSELLIKCAEKDKERYTIAFQASLTGSHGVSDIDQRVHNSNTLLYKHYLSKSDRIKNLSNALINSDYSYTTWGKINKINKEDQYNCNINSNANIDRAITTTTVTDTTTTTSTATSTATKSSCSLPNIPKSLVTNNNRALFCPVANIMPLYDLQNSHSSNSHSSSSEFSTPRSLIKMFIRNRRSPSSSGQISLSLSGDSHSPGSNLSTPTYPYFNHLELISETNNNHVDYMADEQINKNSKDILYEDSLVKENTSLDRVKGHLKHTSGTVDKRLNDTNENIMNSNYNEAKLIRECNNYALNSETEISSRLAELRNNNNRPMLRKADTFEKTNKPNKEGSFSSGYISSRHGSDLTKTPGRLLNNNNNKNNKTLLDFSITTTRTIATQIPVHIQDKQVQASLVMDRDLEFHVKDNKDFAGNKDFVNNTEQTPSLTPNQVKPLYVYYPNYSLPDLSFLQNIYDKQMSPQVYLSPVTHQKPNRQAVSAKLRNQSKTKTRPKSYTDYETLTKQNFTHIKDWDSLNILLPNEFKELIEKLNLNHNYYNNHNHYNNNTHNNDPNPKSTMSFSQTSQNNTVCDTLSSHNSGVKMRSPKKVEKFFPRRHNLINQESERNYRINAPNRTNKRYSLQEPFPSFVLSNGSNTHQDCYMSRSITMPDCHYSCQCHHTCCHTCCRIQCCSPQINCHSPMTPTKIPLGNSPSNELNVSSIDKLCQLFSMDLSIKKMINLINGSNDTPMSKNQCEPVQEVNEDYYVDTNENISNQNNNNLLLEQDKERRTNESSSFKELKQRWESMANNNANNNTNNNNNNNSNNNNSVKTKFEKPKSKITENVVLRRPKLTNSNQIKRPQSAIIRPTTLNVELNPKNQRKSMIPIPKSGSVKSPIFKPQTNIPLAKSRLSNNRK